MVRLLRAIPSFLKRKAVEIAYPSTCAGCGQRGMWVCDLCILDFTPLLSGSCCDRCGHPFILGRCECRMMHPAIVQARAMTVFDGWVANAVRGLKYNGERDRAEHLADGMSPAFASLPQPNVIIPVPLHPTRQEWRGFNQADLLAQHLGRGFGVSVEQGLQRIRATASQTRSSREERAANMEGAFALDPEWTLDPATHYVLLDDVYTTGATIGACAEVLEGAGAKLISAITVAFDLRPRDLELYKKQVNEALH